MQPTKLYPQDFIQYVNSSLPPLDAYQVLLKKCQGKTITDLFNAAIKLVEQEDAPDELTRIRACLVYMDDKIPEIIDHECYRVVKSVRKMVSTRWLGDPVASCQKALREISDEIEHKISEVADETFKKELELKRKILEQAAAIKDNRIKEHPNIGTLLAVKEFRLAAAGMLLRESTKGRRGRKAMIETIVQEFRALIAHHGFHIGSMDPEFKQYFVNGDEELDIIEAALFAGAGNLHLFVLHLNKIPKEEDRALSGEEQFYFMNICYAVQTVSGVSGAEFLNMLK